MTIKDNFKVRVLDYGREINCDWLGEIGSVHNVVDGILYDKDGYAWHNDDEEPFSDFKEMKEYFLSSRDGGSAYWAIFELVEEPEYNPDDVKLKPTVHKSDNITLTINGEEIEGTPVSKLEFSHDPINHPSHYTQGNIEVIDYIEDKNMGYNLGNAIKYISRCEHKGNKIQDLEKAIWYIEREIYRSLTEEKE